MYNKLFTKILDSTIWLAPTDQRIVWITFIAAMDEDGFVALSSVQNVANRARVSVDAAAAAIQAFEAPDPIDTEQDHDGRRIERAPGGWFVLNAAKYREMVTRTVSMEANRRRQAKYREKKRNALVTLSNENVTISDAVSVSVSVSDAVSEFNTTASTRPIGNQAFDVLRSIYPKRSGSQPWSRAVKAFNARLAEGHSPDQMEAGLMRYVGFLRETGKLGSEFVMQAATFFGPDKHFLEPWTPPASKAQKTQDENIATLGRFANARQ